MSKAKGQNNKRPNDQGAGPTRSFDGLMLGPGGQIGSFRIEQEIGRGGAGVVYLAHDTKLDRSVAIKSLPAEVMANSKARLRFTRKARVLASLNHPNIATIYEELEEVEGLGYLVLEYVPGQTLAERISKSKLKLQEVLTIASQIAEAVAAAHEHDVIHRDLKPGNIKITPEGKVKVLDFGLAKAIGGEAVDQQSTVTEPGRIIGTPAYMSPEQARGKPTDKRCDIWSFGCMMYEMLTSKVPFEGETVSDTLAGILDQEPRWEALPQNTPANIRVLLRRCLEKNPHHRLHDIADARIEISESQTGSSMAFPALPQARIAGVSWKRIVRSFLMIMAATIAGVVIAFFVFRVSPRPVRAPWSFSPDLSPAPSPYRFWPEIALSRDGTRLVYAASDWNTMRLYIRTTRGGDVQPLDGTDRGGLPFFSPDGRWVGFFAERKLKKVSLESGEILPLCDAPERISGASWGDDDSIIFAQGGMLRYVPAAGGDSTVFSEPNEGEWAHLWPDILPGAKGVLFTVVPKKSQYSYNANIVVCNLRSPDGAKIVVKGGTQPFYVPTGHIVYGRAGTLYAVPFNLGRLEPTGRPFPVHEGVWMNERYGSVQFAISRDEGTLAYLPGAPGGFEARRMLVWVDRQGKREPVPHLPHGAYCVPRISPDGHYVAVQVLERGNLDIWVYDLESGTGYRITSNPGADRWPLWTPDSERVVFFSDREESYGLFWRRRDGSDQIERLTKSNYGQCPNTWSADGNTLVYMENDDLWLLEDVEGKRTSRRLLPTPTPFEKKWPVISPDGRYIAYVSDEIGYDEIYVRPFPDAQSNRWKISLYEANEPLWALPDGKELFYRDSKIQGLVAVRIERKPEFSHGKPEPLFGWDFPFEAGRDYDISPDGQRFLFVREGDVQGEDVELIIVQDWFDELEQIAAPEKD